MNQLNIYFIVYIHFALISCFYKIYFFVWLDSRWTKQWNRWALFVINCCIAAKCNWRAQDKTNSECCSPAKRTWIVCRFCKCILVCIHCTWCPSACMLLHSSLIAWFLPPFTVSYTIDCYWFHLDNPLMALNGHTVTEVLLGNYSFMLACCMVMQWLA